MLPVGFASKASRSRRRSANGTPRSANSSATASLGMARSLGRTRKCQNFPEVFAIQSEWVRDAADDYLKEMSKLMEVNSRIMSGLLGSVGQVGMPSAAEMPTSPVAHSAFEAPVSPEARSASETHASPEVRLGPETRFQPATRSSPARSTAKAED